MIRIKIKEADATIYVLQPGEGQVKGQACFTSEELEWARTLEGDFKGDREQIKGFWEVLIERKIAGGASYSLFQDHPRREVPRTERARVAQHYGEQIQLMFDESKRKKQQQGRLA